MKIVSNIFYIIFITLLLGVAGLFLVPLLPIESNIEMKIVESGSMEPAITTGSLVMIMPVSPYGVGDVITFESRSADVPTTHRIVSITEENGGNIFTTKGDANEEVDTDTVRESDILGKVQVAIPYAGFVLDFARQPLGFALLIVLPAFMIVLGEIEKIWQEIRKRRNDKNDGTPTTVTRDSSTESEREMQEIVRMIEIGRPVLSYRKIPQTRHLSVRSLSPNTRGRLSLSEMVISVCAIVSSVSFASVSFVGSTVSYFSDTEASVQNELRAAALDFSVLADGETSDSFRTDFIDNNGTLITMVAGENDSADATYTVVAEKMSGSDLFCGAILVSSSLPVVYNGPLLQLTATGVSFADPWELSFSLAPDVVGLVPNEVCLIDIVYTAAHPESETGVGYSDTERVRVEFYAPTPTPEAFGAFSLPEEAVSLLGEETATSSTTEPVIQPPSESGESSAEVDAEAAPPAEEPGAVPQPPEETTLAEEPTAEPIEGE